MGKWRCSQIHYPYQLQEQKDLPSLNQWSILYPPQHSVPVPSQHPDPTNSYQNLITFMTKRNTLLCTSLESFRYRCKFNNRFWKRNSKIKYFRGNNFIFIHCNISQKVTDPLKFHIC